jgi:Spy/CpxP family protein refolding chaperone
MDANRNNRRAIGLVLVVFALGIALGALGAYVVGAHAWGARREAQRPRDRRTRMVQQLTEDLNLTSAQQKQVDAILANMQAKYEEIHKQIAPQTEQARQQGREQIRAILTPDQKPKFEEFLRRLDEERRKRSGQ